MAMVPNPSGPIARPAQTTKVAAESDPKQPMAAFSGHMGHRSSTIEGPRSTSLAYFLCHPLITFLQDTRSKVSSNGKQHRMELGPGANEQGKQGTSLDHVWTRYLLQLKDEIEVTLGLNREQCAAVASIRHSKEEDRNVTEDALTLASEGRYHSDHSDITSPLPNSRSHSHEISTTTPDFASLASPGPNSITNTPRAAGNMLHVIEPSLSIARHDSYLSLLQLPSTTPESRADDRPKQAFAGEAHKKDSGGQDMMPQKILSASNGSEKARGNAAVIPYETAASVGVSRRLSSQPHAATGKQMVLEPSSKNALAPPATPSRMTKSIVQLLPGGRRGVAVEPSSTSGNENNAKYRKARLMSPGFLIPIQGYSELNEVDASLTVMAKIFGFRMQRWFTAHSKAANRLMWFLLILYASTLLTNDWIPRVLYMPRAGMQIFAHLWLPLCLSAQTNWHMTINSITRFDYFFIFFEVILFLIAVLCMQVSYMQKNIHDSLANPALDDEAKSEAVNTEWVILFHFSAMWVSLAFNFLSVLSFCDGFHHRMRVSIRYYYLAVFTLLLAWLILLHFHILELPAVWYSSELSLQEGIIWTAPQCGSEETNVGSAAWKHDGFRIALFDFWLNRGLTVSFFGLRMCYNSFLYPQDFLFIKSRMRMVYSKASLGPP